jgi:hypothetical protein
MTWLDLLLCNQLSTPITTYDILIEEDICRYTAAAAAAAAAREYY